MTICCIAIKTKINDNRQNQTWNTWNHRKSWLFLRIIPRGTLPIPTTFVCNESQPVSSWTGYNAAMLEIKVTHTVATYVPVIDAKPADPSTVYTTMIRQRSTNDKSFRPTEHSTNHVPAALVMQRLNRWNGQNQMSSKTIWFFWVDFILLHAS